MDRQASVLVSDELYVSLVGKFVAHGIYTSDLTIAAEQLFAPQLVFLFQIGTDTDDPFERLQVQVTLPRQSPRVADIPVVPVTSAPERSRWTIHWPLLVQNIMLCPGSIEAKVIHERGEILIPAPRITLAPDQPPPASPN